MPNANDTYFFDRAGRLTSTARGGWFISHGLSGRSVAKRWRNGRREIHSLSPMVRQAQQEKVKTFLTEALSEPGRRNVTSCSGTSREDVDDWLHRALGWDPAADVRRFRETYQPVGILPPDQYGACVIQLTEGCRWNRCTFCSFYKRERFHQKSPEEIARHVDQVQSFLGEGLSLRTSVFLGEANAMTTPMYSLLFALEQVQEKLVPHMPRFRGVGAFMEPSDSSCHSAEDFRRLKAAGLRWLYYGLETGIMSLRRQSGKPGSLAHSEASIRRAKEAGFSVGVIFMVGIGGQALKARHVAASQELANQLPLAKEDVIYISPLRGISGTREEPLTESEIDEQVHCFRSGLKPFLRTAPYDIREFVY